MKKNLRFSVANTGRLPEKLV